MAYRLVTCPETAHLELLEYAQTPLGMLTLGCSRFRPPCAVGCQRTCAALLDRRARKLEGDALDDRVLAVGDDTSLDVLGALSLARWLERRVQ
jgi:hypothetical protein